MIETQLASSLVEWFWNHGSKRHQTSVSSEGGGSLEKYRLPIDQWVARLYSTRDALHDLAAAAEPRRPAFALWGLSQTGKSTALSFIDGGVQLPGVDGEDGKGGGLHWEGGLPFIYQPPLRNPAPEHWHGCAYNPFNGEDDGSACLTRLVAAEPGRGEGWRVPDPMHPAIVRLLKPIELLNTIARGYDTQCLGPEKSGRHTPWTAKSLEEKIDVLSSELRSKVGTDATEPDRVATERVLLLIQTIEDLASVRVETFSKIADDLPTLRSMLERLLLQREIFVANQEAADAATAELLWGGAAFVTDAYRRLRAWHEKLLQAWEGKEVRATLPTAMLFVDFGSGINRLKGKTQAARQRIQGQLIEKLGWKDTNGMIQLGSGTSYSNRLGATAEDYAMTQALIWELVLPVNMAHLTESSGKRLLAQADILDFPGVGKDALNETSRLNLGVGNLPGGKHPEATDFFGKILKRGKTASVVANYSARRNIDAFAILQSLKTDTAPSAEMTGQILEGCEAWARFAGYPTVAGATSPLPLHFVLTFWGLKASQFRAGTAGNFHNAIGKMIESYGWVRTRSTAWALNYHWFRTPDGEVLAAVDLKRFAYGTDDYVAVTSEKEFLDVYGNEISRASFDSMLQDRTTGGLDYFLGTLATQLSIETVAKKQGHLNELLNEQRSRLNNLLSFPFLLPPATEKDQRIEVLVDFRHRIIERSAPFGENQVREVSYALREFFNVDAERLPFPPLDPEEINAAYIDRLFFIWRDSQTSRIEEDKDKAMVRWELLGCSTQAQYGEVLQALIECLGEKVFAQIARSAGRWLRSLEGQQPDYRSFHLRRYLALEMTNWLCYFFPDPDFPEARRRPSPDRDRPFRFAWPEALEETQARTPCMRTVAWQQFPGPVLDEHLAYILGTKSKKPERPALVGDDELLSLVPQQY